MCTVAVDRSPKGVVSILAVRDELVGREFDDPEAWWPDQPGAVGGRDRHAGGSWCVSDPATGVTALVLNRPERPAGTPSRGTLPLAALAHGERWTDALDHRDMASFILLLVGPTAAVSWTWDGTELTRADIAPGLHVTTPRGVDPDDARARRVTPLLVARDWHDVVTGERRSGDDDALLVRHAFDGGVYATVFVQLISATPGRLRIEHTRTPEDPASWVERTWPAGVA